MTDELEVEAQLRKLVTALEHHQLSVQSVWEEVEAISKTLDRWELYLERWHQREEEQFRWRVEARAEAARKREANETQLAFDLAAAAVAHKRSESR